MASLDHGLKIIANVSPKGLTRIAGLDCLKLTPVESTIQTTMERLADRAFRTQRGRQRFVVYMEFVASWTAEVCWSILEKSGMLARRERLPVVSLVYILRPQGYRDQSGTMRLEVDGTPTQQVWFEEIRLWELVPQEWWADEPGLMAIYPLSKHGRTPSESILWAANAIEASERDPIVRADLLTTLGIFGRLAYPGVDALSLIGREKMKESKAYLEILEEGESTGIVKARRTDILLVVEERFGKKAASGLKTPLNAIDSPEQLSQVLRIASRCVNMEDLRKVLAGP